MIEVVYEAKDRRSAAYDGEKLVGECDCEENGKIWTAYHTEVDPAYGGQGIAGRLRDWIETVWKQRPIGSQIRLSEIWTVVRETENVRLIHRILVEGSYDEGGQTRLIPLEGDMNLPFAVVESGIHQVRLQ